MALSAGRTAFINSFVSTTNNVELTTEQKAASIADAIITLVQTATLTVANDGSLQKSAANNNVSGTVNGGVS